MGKLYFQKLRKGIKYALVYFLTYIFGSNLLVTVANFFKGVPVLQLLIVLGIPGVIIFVWGSVTRWRDKEKGKAYKKALELKAGNFKAEIGYLFGLRDFKAELFSGVTYALLISALLTLPGTMPAWPIRLLNWLIYFVIFSVVYALGNFVSWVWVQKKYRNDDLL